MASPRRSRTRSKPARALPALRVEWLEDRSVPSSSILAVGADAGGGPRVTVTDRSTGAVLQDFYAYDPSFTGGVRVAVGDLNGDGTPDVVTAPGAGGGPRVRVFDGKTGAVLQDFYAFDPSFTGGVNIALGDVNRDGVPDIIAGADAGGGPRVRVFDGKTGAVLRDFYAFGPSFTGGVRVAAADVNGDGAADVIAAAGPGGGPAVRVFDGTTGNQIASFYAFEPGFTGGVYVAAGDLTGAGTADVIVGAGAGGGPAVRVFDPGTGNLLSSFFAFDQSFTGGVRVGTISLNPVGAPDILAAPGAGTGAAARVFGPTGGTPLADLSAFGAGFQGGAYVAGSVAPVTLSSLAAAPTASASTTTSATTTPSTSADPALVTLNLNPLDVNLLGLELKTDTITVTVSAQAGSGQLLGNVLTAAGNLINLQGVNNALNNVLGSVVTLLNSASLSVSGVNSSGPLGSVAAATTPVLDLYVAPVHLNLLGALVDTSPIHLTLTAHSGDGLILGNVVTDLANLFNPPLPKKLDLNTINTKLQQLLSELNTQIPNIGSSPTTAAPAATGSEQVLQLTVPPIDLNLLGLNLTTSQIQVNADAVTGNADLLGNVLTTLLNTLGATPDQLTALSNNLNALLAKVVGVLNASSLTLATGAVGSLSQLLQTLSLPNLVNTSGTPASTPVLNLAIASTDGTTPPVDVNLLGLNITTSNIQAQLTAQTGDGQILGNLVYNVSHLLDPGGVLGLLTILNQLAV